MAGFSPTTPEETPGHQSPALKTRGHAREETEPFSPLPRLPLNVAGGGLGGVVEIIGSSIIGLRTPIPKI